MTAYLRYLKGSIWDFLLLAVAASSATAVVESGFWCGDALIEAPLVLLAGVLAVLAVLYLLSYDRRTILIALPLVPVLCAAAIGLSTLAWEGAPFEDVAGNPCLALLILILTTLAVYLLSRRRGGIVALAAIGILVCGYVQFVYHENHVLPVVLFFLSCLAIFAYRYYERTQLLAPAIVRVRRGAASGLAWAGAVVALAVALCCYGVVAVIDPPTIDVKLLRDYIALPEIDMRGVADSTPLDDEEQHSDDRNEEQELSSNVDDEQDDESEEGEGGASEGNSTSNEQLQESFDETASDAGFMAISYDAPLFPLIVLLVVVVLVSPWLIKLALRRRWYAKVCALDPSRQVEAFYRFFLARFGRMKLGREAHLTPNEYALASSGLLDAFVTPDGRGFASVTDAFTRVYYGRHEAGEDDVACCRDFYRAFYPNCKRHLGVIGYVLRFFRL